MNNFLISVIMPVKNGANYISEALKAIKSQNVEMEIIVVDDASNDDTIKIAESFNCIVLKHDISKGPTIAKNTALKIAKGKYIMFHDHDDVMNENCLMTMLKELQENEEISAVMAQLKDFVCQKLSKQEKQKISVRTEPYFGLLSGAILMKKDVFDVIGLFYESLQAGDAMDWNGKMNSSNLQIKKLNFVSVNRRIHDSNFGRTKKTKEFTDYATILRSKIKRNNQNLF